MKTNEDLPLATEMLKEIKQSSKRKDIIIILLIISIVVTNLIWIIRENQFETVTTEEQYMEDIDNSNNSSYTQTIN